MLEKRVAQRTRDMSYLRGKEKTFGVVLIFLLYSFSSSRKIIKRSEVHYAFERENLLELMGIQHSFRTVTKNEHPYRNWTNKTVSPNTETSSRTFLCLEESVLQVFSNFVDKTSSIFNITASLLSAISNGQTSHCNYTLLKFTVKYFGKK